MTAPIGTLVSLSLCLWLPAAAHADNSAVPAATTLASAPSPRFDTALRKEIAAMSADDQKVRKNAGAGMSKEEIEEMLRVDQIHEKRMKEIIAQHGWPGKSLVGAGGSVEAWCIVQHGSQQFEEECLPLLERAVAAGEADPKNYAYLLDRVRMYQGRPQVYGTQFRDYELWTLEDPEHIDERRRAIGLGPIAEYIAEVERIYKKPDKSPLPGPSDFTPAAGASAPPAETGNR